MSKAEASVKERLASGDGTVSPTRRVLGWLEQGLGNVDLLETNMYWKPTKKTRDLKSEDRDVSRFKFLFDEVRPRVMVVHGKKAYRAFSKVFGEIPGNCVVLEEKHFSRGWSETKAKELVIKIKNALGSGLND